jgi:hypothetical protein
MTNVSLVKKLMNWALLETLSKKCIVFYSAISCKELFMEFDIKKIDSITSYKIKTDLKPVIRKKENFDLEAAKERVEAFILEILVLNDAEKQFLTCFTNKEYKPELLFAEQEILDRIKEHPMVIWKMQN